jgi:ribosomal protein L37AE/L43A
MMTPISPEKCDFCGRTNLIGAGILLFRCYECAETIPVCDLCEGVHHDRCRPCINLMSARVALSLWQSALTSGFIQ